MPTVTKTASVRKLYFGRRRAKDTVKALERLGKTVQARVWVIQSPLPPNQGGATNADAQIIIDVICPVQKENEVRGMMALGTPEKGDYEPDNLLMEIEDCLEFYQGSGLFRFRGA